MMKAIHRLTHLFAHTRGDTCRKAGASSAWAAFSAALPFAVVVILSLLFSCVDDSETPYARHPAFFRFSPVTAAPKTLFPALGNPGEWCLVSLRGTQYIFTSQDGKTDSYPQTSLEQYGRTTWISGLLVGTPTVPEMGAEGFAPVCFDLVCPNCYESGGITRAVSLVSVIPARAECSRCRTFYDLDNGGIVVESNAQRPLRLYRYRCHYDNNTFVVQN